MNICFLTVKITESPKKLLTTNKEHTELNICFPKIKNNLFYTKAKAKGKVGEELFNLYVKGDYIIIECQLLRKKDSLKQNIEIVIKTYYDAHIIYITK